MQATHLDYVEGANQGARVGLPKVVHTYDTKSSL